MGETSIEWTDRTWNPVRGCSRISEGCRNCYAERQAARYSADADRPGAPAGAAPLPFHGFAEQTAAGPRWTGKVELVREKLGEPLSWRKPQKVFVNSMSDLFHEALPFERIAAVFGVMAACQHITLQILTKRAARMAEFFRWAKRTAESASVTPLGVAVHYAQQNCDRRELRQSERRAGAEWPLPNVWLGVSVERQQEADERVPLLLQTPAAVRFVSYEPALGPVDFRFPGVLKRAKPAGFDAMSAARQSEVIDAAARAEFIYHAPDWIIVGGESGPGARPFDIAWARETVRQCREAGVAVFVKQLGARPVWDGSGQWPPGVRSALLDRGELKLKDPKGGNPDEWPEDLRVREFPEVAA